jgi:hypothetical protein
VLKWRAFQFYIQLGKTEKSRVGGDDSHFVFGQEFPGEKGSVRQYRDATTGSFAAKVRGEVFAHFHAVAINRHSSIRD